MRKIFFGYRNSFNYRPFCNASLLRDYLHSGFRVLFKSVLEAKSRKAERLYQEVICLKEVEGRNLREAFMKFKKASQNGHKEATNELADCYLHGRGCERDLMKALELGDSKLKLEVAKTMEKERKESE